MNVTPKTFGLCGAAAGLFVSLVTGSALADGMIEAGAPGDDAGERKLAVTVTLGATSDYVFRGVSQTDEDPAAQGSIDLTYGTFYAGIWASNVDFNDAPPATAEIDLYAGIRPVWGPVTFDLGVLYYAYPNAGEVANFIAVEGELDYVEIKAGYSLASPWIKDLTTGTTVYYSPDYSLDTGDVLTIESTAAYALPAFGKVTPTISGVYGRAFGDADEGFSVGGTTDDDYNYWNVGLALAIEKFTFDFRYWDTDIDVVGLGGTVCALERLCDERFVVSGKVTLP